MAAPCRIFLIPLRLRGSAAAVVCQVVCVQLGRARNQEEHHIYTYLDVYVCVCTCIHESVYTHALTRVGIHCWLVFAYSLMYLFLKVLVVQIDRWIDIEIDKQIFTNREKTDRYGKQADGEYVRLYYNAVLMWNQEKPNVSAVAAALAGLGPSCLLPPRRQGRVRFVMLARRLCDCWHKGVGSNKGLAH